MQSTFTEINFSPAQVIARACASDRMGVRDCDAVTAPTQTAENGPCLSVDVILQGLMPWPQSSLSLGCPEMYSTPWSDVPGQQH